VLTVLIDINDKAQFDNTSDRSREAGSKGSLSGALGFGGLGVDAQAGKGSASLDGSAETHSKGQGTIDRSEKLRLTVAAVVSEVLPDGNLMVSGSQEVRVNFEVRVLNVAGIVRTLDISADNTIAYDKIAEARVSYGGRGRISEVQQPAWGSGSSIPWRPSDRRATTREPCSGSRRKPRRPPTGTRTSTRTAAKNRTTRAIRRRPSQRPSPRKKTSLSRRSPRRARRRTKTLPTKRKPRRPRKPAAGSRASSASSSALPCSR
jgi:hypothetical protein